MNRFLMLLAGLACALTSLALAQSADPSNLGGTTLCLSPQNTVTLGVDGAGRMDLKGLADRAYAQIKAAFRAQGVKFREANGCTDSASAFYVVFNATGADADGARAFLVAGSVSDWTGHYRTSVDIWSNSRYGTTSGSDSKVVNGLLDDEGTVLQSFVSEWKAANRP